MKYLRRTNRKGQTLVEFALILPLLLVFLIGILEFGRFFLIYASVANAAREGARIGVVNPTDQASIADAVVNYQALTDLTPEISYESSASGIIHTNPGAVALGDRIIVRVTYNVDPLTPFFTPFISEDRQMETEVKRTIRSMKSVVSTYVPAPTVTPVPGVTSTGTPGPVETNTPAPTMTLPPTGTSSPTPAPTATPFKPIEIKKPVEHGDTFVEGIAENGMIVTLRVVQTGLIRSVAVDGATGTFLFDGLPALQVGYVVIVQGYGDQDSAQVVLNPTATPTFTPTPTPIATPTYVADGTIYLSSDAAGENVLSCIPTGTQTFYVQGRYWNTNNKVNQVRIYWDGVSVYTGAGYNDYGDYMGFAIQISPNVTDDPATHPVSAEGRDSKKNSVEEGPVSTSIPICFEETPTPTVGPSSTPVPEDYPDLTILDLTVLNESPIQTYEDIMVSVVIANQGETDVSGLFWLDLYADPVVGEDLEEQFSADYLAINAFAAGTTISTTMFVRDGFDSVGTHFVKAWIDSFDVVAETNEFNNTSGKVSLLVSQHGPTPVPTPTPSDEEPGSISGLTSLLIAGQGYLDQERVTVHVYDQDGRIVGSTISETGGIYLVDNLSPGTYTVNAYYTQGVTQWLGGVTSVPVIENTDTYVEIVLYEVLEQ